MHISMKSAVVIVLISFLLLVTVAVYACTAYSQQRAYVHGGTCVSGLLYKLRHEAGIASNICSYSPSTHEGRFGFSRDENLATPQAKRILDRYRQERQKSGSPLIHVVDERTGKELMTI